MVVEASVLSRLAKTVLCWCNPRASRASSRPHKTVEGRFIACTSPKPSQAQRERERERERAIV